MDHFQFCLIALSSLHHVHWAITILEGLRMEKLQQWETDKHHRFDLHDEQATGLTQINNARLLSYVWSGQHHTVITTSSFICLTDQVEVSHPAFTD